MEKIRLVLGSLDGITILDKHLGDIDNFYIYDILKTKEINFIEKRENIAKNYDHKHGSANKMKKILSIVKDCKLIISQKISPNFKKISKNTNFQPVIVDSNDIKTILNLVAKNFNLLKEYIKERENDKNFDKIFNLKKV